MGAELAAQTVGVIGSGTFDHEDHAAPVGALLAALGVNLLTGGGGGVMRAVSRAFVRQRRGRGICIGVIPCASEADRATPKAGYPNEFVELAIYTHLPYSGDQGTDDLSRNHINILSCAAVVALPGEEGTASEIALAVRYRRPLVVFARDAALAARFPLSVARVGSIDDVARFLSGHLGLP